MTPELPRRWATTGLPEQIGRGLVQRWSEPHRYYHGTSHLAHGLDLLDTLGDRHPGAVVRESRLVELAWWFHDAVHRHDSPHDELSSAALARSELADLLHEASVSEIERLVLITLDHQPRSDDASGALISDVDLHALSLPWPTYRDHVEGLRREHPALADQAWEALRTCQVQQLGARDWLFHTSVGRTEWEPAARANLARELDLLSRR